MIVTRPRPSFVEPRRRESTPLLEAIGKVQPHAHLCLVYTTKAEQFAAVVPYLRLGLERGERCVYIVDENTADEVLRALKDDGVDADAAVEAGALAVISKRDSYLKEGSFDPDRMIRFLEDATTQAEASGYAALRVTGEMTWALGPETGAERLIEYESKLNGVFPRIKGSAICQYNRARFPPAVIKEVIHTHPYVISGGVVAKNPFFIPIEEYLSPAQPVVEVERLLNNIIAVQRSEEALQAGGERFRELVESLNEWVWEVDAKGVYTYVGPQVRELLGYSPEEMLGKRPYDLMPPDEAERVAEVFNAPIAARKPLMGIVNRNLHKDGHTVVLETTGTPILDRAGRLRGYRGIDRDITARERMEDALRLSEKNLSRSQAGAHIGSWFLDLAKNELVWSDETYRLFGILPGTPMTYEKFMEKVHPDDRTKVAAAWAEALEHKPYDIEHRVLADGEVRWVWERAEVEFDPDGRAVRGTGTVKDITARKRAELEREQFFRFFQTSMDPMCMADPNGAFVKTNPAFTETLGYSQAELVSKPFVEFVVPEDKQATVDEMARQLRTGSTLNFENRYLCKDGSVKWLSWRAVYIKEEGITYATARDVTGLKRASEALRRSVAYNRGLIEASLDPLVTIGPDGKITDVNRATELATGRAREDLIGSDFCEYFTQPERARAGYLKVFHEGRVRDYDLEIRRRDGSVIPVLYNAVVYNDEEGKAVGVFAAARDVTERKRAEDEIRRLNDELEERVRVRTAQVEAANKDLEAFAYSVSHDLRAPLRSMDGFSQILMEDFAPKLEPECVRYLGLVRKGAQTMGRLIDDLLAFSRLGRQAMRKSFVAMDEVVSSALESLKDQTQGRQVSFKVAGLAPSEGDFALLTQVWVNLIANALKFTRARPEAVIEIDSHDEAGETVYRIKDNGVGFDMRYVGTLFKVFQRLHPKEEYEGTGVGLAIVARIVERHGGRIWARGEVDRGAEFLFTLGGRKK